MHTCKHLCVEIRLEVSFLKNCPSYFLRPNLSILELWRSSYGWAVSPGNPLESGQSMGLQICTTMSIFPTTPEEKNQCEIEGWWMAYNWYQSWKLTAKLHQNHSVKSGGRVLLWEIFTWSGKVHSYHEKYFVRFHVNCIWKTSL